MWERDSKTTKSCAELADMNYKSNVANNLKNNHFKHFFFFFFLPKQRLFVAIKQQHHTHTHTHTQRTLTIYVYVENQCFFSAFFYFCLHFIAINGTAFVLSVTLEVLCKAADKKTTQWVTILDSLYTRLMGFALNICFQFLCIDFTCCHKIGRQIDRCHIR